MPLYLSSVSRVKGVVAIGDHISQWRGNDYLGRSDHVHFPAMCLLYHQGNMSPRQHCHLLNEHKTFFILFLNKVEWIITDPHRRPDWVVTHKDGHTRTHTHTHTQTLIQPFGVVRTRQTTMVLNQKFVLHIKKKIERQIHSHTVNDLMRKEYV